MNELVLSILFVGNLTVTSYRSVPSQTDSSPWFTSTGERVNPHGIAISQDLLCKDCKRLHHRCKCPLAEKGLHYGDEIYIEGIGFKSINDVMNARHKQRADVWVQTLEQEKAFQKQFKAGKIKVWIVKRDL